MYKFEPVVGSEKFACLLEGVAASVRDGSINELIVVSGDGQLSVWMDGKTQFDALRLMNDAQGALMDLFIEEEDEADDDV